MLSETVKLIMSDASENDISAIMDIADECKLSFWSELDYLGELENKKSFIKVVYVKGKIVGFILARFNFIDFNEQSDNEYSTNDFFREADLLNIGVSNAAQKQGIGSLLLNALIQECKNFQTEKIWLEVRESNSNAREFYKRKGFVETQIRRSFYTNPTENAVLMAMDITK